MKYMLIIAALFAGSVQAQWTAEFEDGVGFATDSNRQGNHIMFGCNPNACAIAFSQDDYMCDEGATYQIEAVSGGDRGTFNFECVGYEDGQYSLALSDAEYLKVLIPYLMQENNISFVMYGEAGGVETTNFSLRGSARAIRRVVEYAVDR